jgi:glycerol kinase
LGAAWLGLRTVGAWSSDDEITRRVKVAQVYAPSISADERAACLERFRRAVALTTGWR